MEIKINYIELPVVSEPIHIDTLTNECKLFRSKTKRILS